MESIAVIKPNTGVLVRGQLALSPFGILAQSFAEALLTRVEREEGRWPFVPLELLEEETTPATPPGQTVLQIDLRLVLEALRKGNGQTEHLQATERIVERILQRQKERQLSAPSTGEYRRMPMEPGTARTTGILQTAFYQTLNQEIRLRFSIPGELYGRTGGWTGTFLTTPGDLARQMHAFSRTIQTLREEGRTFRTGERDGTAEWKAAERTEGVPGERAAFAAPSLQEEGEVLLNEAARQLYLERITHLIHAEEGPEYRTENAAEQRQSPRKKMAAEPLSSQTAGLLHTVEQWKAQPRRTTGEGQLHREYSVARREEKLRPVQTAKRSEYAAIPVVLEHLAPPADGEGQEKTDRRFRAEHTAQQPDAPERAAALRGSGDRSADRRSDVRKLETRQNVTPGPDRTEERDRGTPAAKRTDPSGARAGKTTIETAARTIQLLAVDGAGGTAQPSKEQPAARAISIRLELTHPDSRRMSEEGKAPQMPSRPRGNGKILQTGSRPYPLGRSAEAEGVSDREIKEYGFADGENRPEPPHLFRLGKPGPSVAAPEVPLPTEAAQGTLWPGSVGKLACANRRGTDVSRHPSRPLWSRGLYPKVVQTPGAVGGTAQPLPGMRAELELVYKNEGERIAQTERRQLLTDTAGRMSESRAARDIRTVLEKVGYRRSASTLQYIAPDVLYHLHNGSGTASTVSGMELDHWMKPKRSRALTTVSAPLQDGSGSAAAFGTAQNGVEKHRRGGELLRGSEQTSAPTGELALVQPMGGTEENTVRRELEGQMGIMYPLLRTLPPVWTRNGDGRAGRVHSDPFTSYDGKGTGENQGERKHTRVFHGMELLYREGEAGSARDALSALCPVGQPEAGRGTVAQDIRMSCGLLAEGILLDGALERRAGQVEDHPPVLPADRLILRENAHETEMGAAVKPDNGRDVRLGRAAWADIRPARRLWRESAAGPEPVELLYGPANQGSEQSRFRTEEARQTPTESDYVRSLPDWARRFLMEGGGPPAAPREMGVARSIAALPAGEEAEVQWTAPSYRPPSANLSYREKRREEPLTPVPESPVSDTELQRTADKVYRMIEERIRRERRRLGL